MDYWFLEIIFYCVGYFGQILIGILFYHLSDDVNPMILILGAISLLIGSFGLYFTFKDDGCCGKHSNRIASIIFPIISVIFSIVVIILAVNDGSTLGVTLFSLNIICILLSLLSNVYFKWDDLDISEFPSNSNQSHFLKLALSKPISFSIL